MRKINLHFDDIWRLFWISSAEMRHERKKKHIVRRVFDKKKYNVMSKNYSRSTESINRFAYEFNEFETERK